MTFQYVGNRSVSWFSVIWPSVLSFLCFGVYYVSWCSLGSFSSLEFILCFEFLYSLFCSLAIRFPLCLCHVSLSVFLCLCAGVSCFPFLCPRPLSSPLSRVPSLPLSSTFPPLLCQARVSVHVSQFPVLFGQSCIPCSVFLVVSNLSQLCFPFPHHSLCILTLCFPLSVVVISLIPCCLVSLLPNCLLSSVCLFESALGSIPPCFTQLFMTVCHCKLKKHHSVCTVFCGKLWLKVTHYENQSGCL